MELKLDDEIEIDDDGYVGDDLIFKKEEPEDITKELYDKAALLVKCMLQSIIERDIDKIVMSWFLFRVDKSSTPILRLKEMIKSILSCDIIFDIECQNICIFKNAPYYMIISLSDISVESGIYLKTILSAYSIFFANVETGVPGNTSYYGFRFLSVVRGSSIRNKILMSLIGLLRMDNVRDKMNYGLDHVILTCVTEEIMHVYEDYINNKSNIINWRKKNFSHLQNLDIIYRELTKEMKEKIVI
jgi:hypothetical protein